MTMERKMRRIRQLLPEEETKQILKKCTNGVLSLIDKDGMPYGVPMSFVYDGDMTIYFHCAVAGHKIECIGDGCHCSFCVVGQDEIIAEKFTTYFSSAIVFGNISVVNGEENVVKALRLICEKYSPGIDSENEILRNLRIVKILRLDIERITGKKSIELINQ